MLWSISVTPEKLGLFFLFSRDYSCEWISRAVGAYLAPPDPRGKDEHLPHVSSLCFCSPLVPVVPRNLQLLCYIKSLLFSTTGVFISPVDLYTISPQACLLIPFRVVTVSEACWLSAEEVWPVSCLVAVLECWKQLEERKFSVRGFVHLSEEFKEQLMAARKRAKDTEGTSAREFPSPLPPARAHLSIMSSYYEPPIDSLIASGSSMMGIFRGVLD